MVCYMLQIYAAEGDLNRAIEEMEKAGAVEILMPVVQPADLWMETGRWDKYGGELYKYYPA